MSRNYVPPKVPPQSPAGAYAPPPPRRSPKGRIWKVLLLGATFLAVVGGGSALLMFRDRLPSEPGEEVVLTPPPSTQPATTRAASRPGTREVMPREPTLAASEVNTEILNMFDGLGAAVAAENGAAVRAFFDRPRFEDEVGALGRAEGLAFAKRMSGDFERLFRTLPSLPPQRSDVQQRHVRLRKVTLRPSGEEAVVAVRTSAGPAGRSRWWLRKVGGAWRWYDYEGAAEVLRSSEMLAINLPTAPAERPVEWLGRVGDLVKMFGAWVKDDYAAVQKDFDASNGVAYPPRLQAVRLYFGGASALRVREVKPEVAIDAMNKTRELKVDAPRTLLLLATAQNDLGQPEKALSSLWGYREEVGEDAAADYQRGRAHELMHDPSTAVADYRKGLAENPGDAECRKALERISPDDPMLDAAP